MELLWWRLKHRLSMRRCNRKHCPTPMVAHGYHLTRFGKWNYGRGMI